MHTHYAQAVAVTGRLSSNDPNLQNIPIRTPEGRRVREAFVAPAGSLIVSADYSQIELRIMAHISGDEALLRAFTAGEDVHRATAAEVFGVELAQVSADQRRSAKVINFGLIYGMGAYGLAKSLGIDNTAAKNYIQRYFERFAGVKQYMDDTRAMAKEKGYVETVFGRRLQLADIQNAKGATAGRAGARRHQRAHAGHGGRSDQAEHGRGAESAGRTAARHQDDHAGARRTGVRGARGRSGLGQDRGAAPDGGCGSTQGAVAGRGGHGPQLGPGALSLDVASGAPSSVTGWITLV